MERCEFAFQSICSPICKYLLFICCHSASAQVGFPCGSAGKESVQFWRPGSNPWVGKTPWRRERLPNPVFWPGEFHGVYSPRSHKESDTTEWFSLLESSINRSLKNILLKIRKEKWNLKYPTHVFPVKSLEHLILATTFLYSVESNFEKPCNKPLLGEVNATNTILRCSSLITSYSFSSINLTEIHPFFHVSASDLL